MNHTPPIRHDRSAGQVLTIETQLSCDVPLADGPEPYFCALPHLEICSRFAELKEINAGYRLPLSHQVFPLGDFSSFKIPLHFMDEPPFCFENSAL